jgi:hypothetical protein
MEVIVMTGQALKSLRQEDPQVAQRLKEAIEERLTTDRS